MSFESVGGIVIVTLVFGGLALRDRVATILASLDDPELTDPEDIE